jgi:hypothetical protein
MASAGLSHLRVLATFPSAPFDPRTRQFPALAAADARALVPECVREFGCAFFLDAVDPGNDRFAWYAAADLRRLPAASAN